MAQVRQRTASRFEPVTTVAGNDEDTIGRNTLPRVDKFDVRRMTEKGWIVTSGVSVLKDITLPVGDLCIAPRFCSAFRDRHTRNVINARNKSTDEIGNHEAVAIGFHVDSESLRICAVIAHDNFPAEDALRSFTNE